MKTIFVSIIIFSTKIRQPAGLKSHQRARLIYPYLCLFSYLFQERLISPPVFVFRSKMCGHKKWHQLFSFPRGSNLKESLDDTTWKTWSLSCNPCKIIGKQIFLKYFLKILIFFNFFVFLLYYYLQFGLWVLNNVYYDNV
jgi:hypothetical protein